MKIHELNIKHFRNLSEVSLKPAEKLNLIVGLNASGKTSILEAIYFMAVGKSFRESAVREIIRRGEPQLQIVSRLSGGPSNYLGMERSQRQTKMRWCGEEIKTQSELASILPIQLIHPESQKIINGTPKDKRQFLDWGVFHVKHSFREHWGRYRGALKQRNAALQQQASDDLIHQWDEILAGAGGQIHSLREEYLNLFQPVALEYCRKLVDLQNLRFHYEKGWGEIDLMDALKQNLPRDRRIGYTTQGPHRADLKIMQGEFELERRASRGQQKLLAAALLFAQHDILDQEEERESVILIDDLPAELDEANRQRLMDLALSCGGQIFITLTHPDLLAFLDKKDTNLAMFHVEHGEIVNVL